MENEDLIDVVRKKAFDEDDVMSPTFVRFRNPEKEGRISDPEDNISLDLIDLEVTQIIVPARPISGQTLKLDFNITLPKKKPQLIPVIVPVPDSPNPEDKIVSVPQSPNYEEKIASRPGSQKEEEEKPIPTIESPSNIMFDTIERSPLKRSNIP